MIDIKLAFYVPAVALVALFTLCCPLHSLAASTKIDALEAQVKKNPQSAEDRVALGWAYVENKMPDRAEIEFRAATALQPDSQDAYMALSAVYKERRNYTEALAYFRKAIAAQAKKKGGETTALSDMSMPVNYLSYGWLLQEAGQADKAVAMFKSATKASPDNPDPYQALSSAYSTMNKPDEALRWFRQGLVIMAKKKGSERAVLSDMDSPLNYGTLGMLYSTLRQYPLAIENLSQAVKLQPNNKNLLSSLAEAHLNSGHKAEYLEYMKKALAAAVKEKGTEKAALSDFSSPVNYISMGMAYQQMDDYDKATRYLQEAVAIQPENLEIIISIAGLYRNSNKPAEALSWSQKALALKSKLKKGEKAALADMSTQPNYVFMGDIYLQAKQYARALEMYQGAIKVEPNNSLHYRAVSNVYAAQARYDDALEWIKKAILVELKQGKA